MHQSMFWVEETALGRCKASAGSLRADRVSGFHPGVVFSAHFLVELLMLLLIFGHFWCGRKEETNLAKGLPLKE